MHKTKCQRHALFCVSTLWPQGAFYYDARFKAKTVLSVEVFKFCCGTARETVLKRTGKSLNVGLATLGFSDDFCRDGFRSEFRMLQHHRPNVLQPTGPYGHQNDVLSCCLSHFWKGSPQNV